MTDSKIPNLLEIYKQKLDEISSKELNSDQKQLAYKILEKFPDKELEYVYQFVVQRIKTGFRFDSAPESDTNTVAILEKDENLSFKFNENNQNPNTLIIGENYDGLKNLLVIERERERERGGFDIIYIDPPYNTEATKNDGNSIANEKDDIKASKFIYRDKFSRNGWLNLMNERLKLARDLLKEDGIIFVSIDDNQQAYLKVLMDEIFGEENFVANFPFISNLSGRQVNTNLALCHEYLLLYKKIISYLIKLIKIMPITLCLLFIPRDLMWFFNEDPDVNKEIYDNSPEQKEDYSTQYILRDNLENSNGEFNPKTRPNLFFPIYARKINEKNKLWDITVEEPDSKHDFIEIWPRKNSKNIQLVWRWGKKKIMNQINDLVIVEPRDKNDKNYRIKVKIFDQSYTVKSFILGKNSIISPLLKELNKIFSESSEKVFNFPKPTALIEYLINLHPNKNARVLDFLPEVGQLVRQFLELNYHDGGTRSFTLITNNQNKIAENVTYERLFRINHGFGTKKSKILTGSRKINLIKTNLDVFRINYFNTEIFNKENDVNLLVKKLEKMLVDFGISSKNNINLIEYLNYLLALLPQKKDKK
ncbi:DNA methyltransferase [Mesomycoplasma hyopneumoniae]|uniref:DNA methyltransferase n=1 Tax=Mesomycoplasma hyopneumoniae TaxID=2099 RepID=UPI003877EC0D